MGGRRTPDLTGKHFGRLTAIAPTQIGNKMHWLCRCTCGTIKPVYAYHLISGRVVSCGCLKRERTIARNYRHGAARRANMSPEYAAWQAMWSRCTYPDNPSFQNYGGRGISVCARWRSFSAFLQDMGEKPTSAHTLERKDNDRDYSPSNCCWATRAEQSRNTRSNVLLTANGETMVLEDWARRLGANRTTIVDRIRRGWPIEDAVTTPPQHAGYKQRRGVK